MPGSWTSGVRSRSCAVTMRRAGRPCVPRFPPQPPTPAAVSWTANMPRWRRFGRLARPPVTRTRRRVTIKLTLPKLRTTTAATVVAAAVAVIGVIAVATTTGEQPPEPEMIPPPCGCRPKAGGGLPALSQFADRRLLPRPLEPARGPRSRCRVGHHRDAVRPRQVGDVLRLTHHLVLDRRGIGPHPDRRPCTPDRGVHDFASRLLRPACADKPHPTMEFRVPEISEVDRRDPHRDTSWACRSTAHWEVSAVP